MNIPQAPEAERAVLGSVLVRPDCIHDIADLAETDFFDPANADVLRAMRGLSANGQRIDVVTLGNALPGCLAHLMALVDAVPSAEGLNHWVGIVRRKGLQRRVLAFSAELGARAASGDDIEETVGDGIAQLAGLATGGDGNAAPRLLGDHMAGVITEIEGKAQDAGKRGVATGIRSFDAMVGGLSAPKLIVVAARPGIGKTAFALTVARNAAKAGVPVLVFSLEMAFQELAERALSAESRVSGHEIGSGRIDYDGFKALYAAGHRLSAIPLYADDRVLTAAQISATARSWYLRQRSDKGLIVVDYLGLIRGTGSNDRNREREVAVMSWTMKTMAKELNLPVMLVSQLNRAAEQQDRPTLANLRESGAVEQDADMVVFPWRNPPLHESGPAELVIAKHRGGPTGLVECHWHAPTMTFADCDNY